MAIWYRNAKIPHCESRPLYAKWEFGKFDVQKSLSYKIPIGRLLTLRCETPYAHLQLFCRCYWLQVYDSMRHLAQVSNLLANGLLPDNISREIRCTPSPLWT